MKIVVLTSGGDSQGMNAFLALANKKLKKHQLFASVAGFKGLIYDNLLPLESFMPERFKKLAGTVIKSSRCPEFKTEDGIKKAVKTLKHHEIDLLIILGGNGSLKGAKELSDFGINIIFVPASIDNDVNYSDYSIGFDTAASQATRIIEEVMPSMESFSRSCIFEVMGRDEADIAIEVSKRTKADYLITNDKDLNLSKLTKLILDKNKNGKSSNIIIRENLLNTFILKEELNNRLKKDIVRNMVIGYSQRGGRPTKKEIFYVEKYFHETYELIKTKMYNRAVGTKNNKIINLSLNEV